MGDSTDAAPNEVSRIGTVNIVAQTVQLSALVMTASALRMSFGAPANGFSSACCSFPAKRMRPSVDANESCRPTLAIAYGLTSSRTASAISSAFDPPDRRRNRNPPAAVRYISAARSTDGVAPATGTNSSTSGMDTTVPHRLPNSSVQNPTRKPMCSPETATKWLKTRNAERGLVGCRSDFCCRRPAVRSAVRLHVPEGHAAPHFGRTARSSAAQSAGCPV